MPKKVSPKDITPGDIIGFHDFIGNKTGRTTNRQLGLVYNVVYGEGHAIKGYEIFPLRPCEKTEHFTKDKHHLLIHNREQITEMGLNHEQNYRMTYSVYVVAYSPQHLTDNGKGGVFRYGTSQGQLFDTILNHAQNLSLRHTALLGLEKEIRRLQGPSDQSLPNIELYQMGEKGRNIRAERDRQDNEESHESARIQEVTIKPKKSGSKNSKHKRRSKHDSAARVYNISMEDAAHIGIIAKETSDALIKKGINTLQEAYRLAKDMPEKLDEYFNKAAIPADKITMGHVRKKLTDPSMQKHLQASLGKTNYQFVLSDVKASNSRDETPIKRARLYSLTLQSLETVLATTYDRKSTAIEIKSAWKTFTNDVQEGVVADDARYEGVTIQYPSLELKIP